MKMKMLPRVIPSLLLRGKGLVKTVKFKDPRYLGDPINIIKIFNDKEVDELTLLDITATIEGRKPPFDYIAKVASECFMPLGYGGGIKDIEDIRKISALGVEKVILNSYAFENPDFITTAADLVGSQSVVVSIDVKKNILGKYEVFIHGGRKNTGADPVRFATQMAEKGAGEILLNSIDRDGTFTGYDISMIQKVTSAVSIPVIACGGARDVQDLGLAVKEGGASAVAAGSMFVYQGKHRAVLINFPTQSELYLKFNN